ncbi:MAG: hypothetical protein IIZ97_05105 [Prevotella sp.]|nr:hypothetical protein [Prevotella sp.]
MFLYHLTIPLTKGPTIHQYPSSNTHHPIGEVLGEVPGEMIREHLTMRNPLWKRLFGHFGEV